MDAFWTRKRLAELTEQEWESLCDGCGKCCLNKLQDVDTERVYYTDVACALLDLRSCRCRDYAHRHRRVPDCVKLEPDSAEAFAWLPSTCAYRCIAEGRELPHWHPLVCGDPQRVHATGNSVRGRAVSEREVDPEALETRIVYWPE